MVVNSSMQNCQSVSVVLPAVCLVAVSGTGPLKLTLLGVLAENEGLERPRSWQSSPPSQPCCLQDHLIFIFLIPPPLTSCEAWERQNQQGLSFTSHLCPKGRPGATQFPWEHPVLLSPLPTQALLKLTGSLSTQILIRNLWEHPTIVIKRTEGGKASGL